MAFHAGFASDKKTAAQIFLQTVNGACDCRLAGLQGSSSFRQIPIFCNIIKDAVVFVIAVHRIFFSKFCRFGMRSIGKIRYWNEVRVNSNLTCTPSWNNIATEKAVCTNREVSVG